MKKFVTILISISMILTACHSQELNESKDETTKKGVTKSNMKVIEDSYQKEVTGDQASDSRTVNVGESPFPFDSTQVEEWINNGERVFLLNDGELLEDRISQGLEMWEIRIKNSKKNLSEEEIENMKTPDPPSFEVEIDYFARDILRYHPDKEGYVDKLREANEHLRNGDEEKLKQAIEEARKLRTQ